MTHLANISLQQAYLFTEFGESFARAKFGDKQIDTLPRFTRGKHAGKIKGLVQWWKVTRGGWVREFSLDGGHVENRVGKVIRAELCDAKWGEQPKVIAHWSLDDDRRARELVARFRGYMNSRDAREAELVAARFGNARNAVMHRVDRIHLAECELDSLQVY